MTSNTKPGVVSFIVFTVVAAILLYESPGEITRALLAVFLWFVWWTGWRWHRKLGRKIDELATEITTGRDELQELTNKLETSLAELRKVSPQASAATVEVATVEAPASDSFPEPPRIEATRVSSPPPPAFSAPAAQVDAQLTFAQVGDSSGEPLPSLMERLRSLLRFEDLLGSNWMAKIGAVILVLGVAFFLVWQLRDLGPGGKAAVGGLVGAALLGAGIFVERKERYRIIGRAGAAAGWAVIFFTAYAMNHIAAAHVISSASVDLALMSVVAAGMVVHTLRYHSQVATGLAFLAAYGAIFATVFPGSDVSPPGVSSLTAVLVLAAGVAWVALRRRWFTLEVCAIAATFFTHFAWLIHIIRPMGERHQPFPEFLPSALLLIGYWAVFRASYLWRSGEAQERTSALAAVLNTGLLMAVLKYQSVHPEYAFWVLLGLGAIELALGQLPAARRRSTPHIVLTVIGACLLMVAIPFRSTLGPLSVSLLWLAEAETFFIVGVLMREQVFRRVGLFAFVPLLGQLLSIHAARIYGARMDGADVRGMFVPAAVCGLAALFLYLNVHSAPRRWAAQFGHAVEQAAMRDLSCAAAVLAFAGGWMAFPLLGAAVFWMALAGLLAWLDYRLKVPPLRLQSTLLAAFAFLRVLTLHLPDTSSYHFRGHIWSARLLTTAFVAAFCYLTAHWQRRQETSLLRWIEPGLTWVGSIMLTLLLWYELSSASVALGWGVFALLMLEAGLLRASANLRWQAYVAGICTFLRLLFVNLNALSPQRWSPRIYTIIPLAALFFYLYQRLNEQAESLSLWERKLKVSGIFAWLGLSALLLLLRFETPLDWVATAWAAIALLAMAVCYWTHERVFLHQALFVSLAVLFRGVMHNLYERSYFTPPSRSLAWLSTVSAAALLFAGLAFAFKLRRTAAHDHGNLLERVGLLLDARPEQLLFFAPLALLTAFLAVELRSGLVTVAWAVEAVLVFLVALRIGERSYRVSAVGLLMLCVGKVAAVDIRHMVIRDKAITFLVLGALIMGVSVLYTKNREKLRQYL